MEKTVRKLRLKLSQKRINKDFMRYKYIAGNDT